MIEAILILTTVTGLLGAGGYLGYRYGRRVEQKAAAAFASARAGIDAIKRA